MSVRRLLSRSISVVCVAVLVADASPGLSQEGAGDEASINSVPQQKHALACVNASEPSRSMGPNDAGLIVPPQKALVAKGRNIAPSTCAFGTAELRRYRVDICLASEKLPKKAVEDFPNYYGISLSELCAYAGQISEGLKSPSARAHTSEMGK